MYDESKPLVVTKIKRRKKSIAKKSPFSPKKMDNNGLSDDEISIFGG